MALTLYSYWRSSSSYRVRIALALKELEHTVQPVHLVRDGGEQNRAEYRALNPQGYVPCLVHDGHAITQSLAILDYLDAIKPAPELLPADPKQRARVLAFALTIATDIQPLQNVSVLKHVVDAYEQPGDERAVWSRHWMSRGFAALETMLAAQAAESFCFGESPTMADVVLVPQMYNARRFELDLSPYPNLVRVDAACTQHPAFIAAHPDNQPDAQAA